LTDWLDIFPLVLIVVTLGMLSRLADWMPPLARRQIRLVPLEAISYSLTLRVADARRVDGHQVVGRRADAATDA
jgi:hypothetical protein